MNNFLILLSLTAAFGLTACGDAGPGTENVTNEAAVQVLDSLKQEVEEVKEDLDAQENLSEETVEREKRKLEERERHIQESLGASPFAAMSAAQIDSTFASWIGEYRNDRSVEKVKRICEAMQDLAVRKHFEQNKEKQSQLARQIKELRNVKGRPCDGL